MKKILLSTILVLGLVSCNNESIDSGISTQELNVTINDNLSRVGFENGTGNFFWTQNDKIGVTTTTSAVSFVSMTLSSESGKSTGTFTGSMSGKPSGYAVYPYIGFRNHSITATGELTYKFPSEYTYSNLDSEYGSKIGNSFNAPMWAEIAEGQGVFFDHLGGVICVTVNNLPVGNNQKFILTTTNQITGEFTADLTTDSPKLVTTESDTNNSVTINFCNSTEDGTGVFYVPVPTGTYDEIIAIVMNGEEEVGIGIWNNQIVNQGSLKKATIGESSLEGGTVTIYDVQTAGTLKELLPDNYLTMKSLKVKGYLNGADIAVIREMAGRDMDKNATEGKLEYLDMKDANIVTSSEAYYYTYTTEENTIGNDMFYQTNLKEIILPNSLTKIGARSFYNCSSLTTIDIPNSVVTIFATAFAHCTNLQNITIPSGITEISAETFSSCSSLTKVTIPNGVTKIGRGAFSGCTSLAEISIPNSVLSIENDNAVAGGAFSNCTNLKSLTLPASVTSLGHRTFPSCI